MKKLFTLFIVCAMVLSVSAQKKIVYLGLDKPMGITDKNFTDGIKMAQIEEDPFLATLKADANFIVDTIIFRENYKANKFYADTVNLNNYDVIIVSESIGGGDSVLSRIGLLGIPQLTKPTLYNKTYAFRYKRGFGVGKNIAPTLTNGGSMGQETASTAGNLITSLQVISGKESHDIFKNITITDNKIQIFDTTAADNARVGAKAINYTVGTYLSEPNTLLATPSGTLTAGHVPVICINDIPAGTVISDTLNKFSHTTAARIITVGFNTGAMHSRSGTNLRPDGLKLLKNAVYSLAGLEIITSVPSTKVNKLSFARTGNLIEVNLGQSQKAVVSVYNIGGQLVSKQQVNSSVASVDLSNEAKGVYIIKVDGSKTIGTHKFLVE